MSTVSQYAGTERRVTPVPLYTVRDPKTQLGGQRAADREKALVQRAIKHDRVAFAQLYDRFVDKIYKYIYYKVGNKTDAEDMTGQVFLKAWEAIGHYRWTDRPFAAWLYRIAHNLVVDYFRTRKDSSSLDDIVSLEHPGTDLDEIVQHHLTAAVLRDALKRLTHDQEQVIILRFLEGYNTAEVAAILGKRPGAVRTLQHRALAGLNTLFRKSAERV